MKNDRGIRDRYVSKLGGANEWIIRFVIGLSLPCVGRSTVRRWSLPRNMFLLALGHLPRSLLRGLRCYLLERCQGVLCYRRVVAA